MAIGVRRAAAWLMAGNTLDVSVYSPQPDCCIAGLIMLSPWKGDAMSPVIESL